jgi:YegS/Rv2252/BmrU family lipid kinase
VEVIQTTHAGHALELARDYRIPPGTDPARAALVVIGGDGSFHELVNGTMQRDASRVGPAPTVGVIPGGTGNALALDLGVSDPEVAAQAVCAGFTREIDLHHVVHSVDSRAVYSMNLVIWGIGSEANLTAEKLRWMGPMRYDVGAFWNIMKNRPHACTLRIDGIVVEDDVPVVDIQLNQYAGNSMRFAPHARVDDGLIDVVFIRRCGRMRLLNLLGLLGKGTHVLAPEVEYVQCQEISLSTPAPEPIVIDGENYATTPVTITCVPQAIRIFTPEN